MTDGATPGDAGDATPETPPRDAARDAAPTPLRGSTTAELVHCAGKVRVALPEHRPTRTP